MKAADAKVIALVLSSVINAVEDGAQSARQIDEGMRAQHNRPAADEEPLLSYPDGWAAAVTMVKLTAAAAMVTARTFEIEQT